MKNVILIVSLFLNHSTTWATDSSTNKEFNQNWSYSPMMSSHEGKAHVKVKQFRRYFWIGKTAVPVADTNFIALNNPSEKVNLKALGETIQKSFPPKMLTPKNISNGIELNGEWKKINRQIKMDIIKKGNEVVIVTSFVRAGLAKALSKEINELHTVLRSYEPKSIIEKTSFIDHFVPSAYAQSLTPAEIAQLLNGSNVTVNSNVSVNTSSEVSNNWNNTNTNLNNLNNNLNQANQNAANANTNWANTNQVGNNANSNWNRTNEVINSNWAESNKVLAQSMDPQHMTKLAFYTAAGAALGSISMNLAVEGVSAGLSFMYELFTGTKKKKLEWEDFQKAIQTWDDQLGDLVKLEKIVDEFINAFDFFNDKKLGNDYIKNLNIAMRDMRFDRDILMEKFKDTNQPTACRKVYYDAADELDQKLKDYEKIMTFAKNNNISTEKNQNYFCQQLKELQRKILTTETQIQDLRLNILKAENQFYDKTSEAKEKREDNIEVVNDRMDKTLKRREEFNKETTEKLKVAFLKERTEWIDKCIDAQNEEGKKIKTQLDSRLLHFFKAKGKCSEAFDATHSFTDREQKALAAIEAENKIRQDLLVKNNLVVDVKLSEEQMAWLTRIHMDAYCYQFAHGPKESIPSKCSQFPEMLYSLSLSRGYEKAKDAYASRCEDRYVAGIQKLADK